jgi:biopolymer transport protein TolQ
MILLVAALPTVIESLPEHSLSTAVNVLPAVDSHAGLDFIQSGTGAAVARIVPDHDGFNILQLVTHASLPVQTIMALLIVASVVSWVIIFSKRRVIARAHVEATRFEERFRSGTELTTLSTLAPQGLDRIGGMEAIFEAGLHEFGRLRQRKVVDARVHLEGAQRAMRATGARAIDGLEHNLELLANIGSTSPYIGLVGTVFGIMVTMHGLLASGAQVGIKDVAPGISEALLATAMGLFVAIPAVWAYNRFASGVERLAVRYDAFAEEFSSILQRQAHTDE